MFKDKLKELREKEGISQQALADKLYVSRSAVAKWENGNGIPSDVNLETICKFFDVTEDWLLDRKELKNTIKLVDEINTKMNILFFSLVSFIVLFCLLVGGSYWLHRISIVFTIIYFIFKLFLEPTKITKIISLLAFVIGIVLSIVNWIITAIPEPWHFIRIFTNITSLNGMNIALSQLSSILNIFMLVGVNSLFLLVNKKDKKQIIGSIFISFWSIIDIIFILIEIVFIIMLFKRLAYVSSIFSSYIHFFKISEKLGGFIVIPLIIFISSIAFSVIDILSNSNIINIKNNKTVKVILVFLFISWWILLVT